MPNSLEDALSRFAKTQAEEDLVALHTAFMKAEVLVRLTAPIKEVAPGRFDVPVFCAQVNGECILPVFTNIIQFSQLKPTDSRATLMTGRQLLELARGMKEVGAILVNPADGPHGRIGREDFARVLDAYQAE